MLSVRPVGSVAKAHSLRPLPAEPAWSCRSGSGSGRGVRQYGTLGDMENSFESPVVLWAWQRQSVWSQAADQLKAAGSRGRRLELILTVSGAALALAGTQVKDANVTGAMVLGALAAAVLAAAGLLRGRETIEQVRRWTRARSVAEAIKTEVFLYLTRVGEYAGLRDEQLDREVQRFEQQAGDLHRFTMHLSAKERAIPAVFDLESYLEVRVRQGQIGGYYEKQNKKIREQFRLFKIAHVALALVAAGLAALAAIAPGVAAWAAVATSAGGALAAHVARERFEFLSIEYSRTADELRRLAERRTAADGRKLSPSDLIAECERVISVQNEAWMVKWGEEIEGGDGST